MRITDETAEKINKRIEECDSNWDYGIKLNVFDSVSGTNIYNNNCQICELNQLTDMIRSLKVMRNVLVEITGFKF